MIDGAAGTRAPWWSLAAVPLFAIGLWTLAADVPGWNAVWYLFAWYSWLLGLDAAVYALAGRSWMVEQGGRRLLAMLLVSVPFWYVYEAYNLRLENWYYVFALRDDRLQLVVSILAFATVLPACFLHAELIAAARLFEHVSWRPLRVDRTLELTIGGLGIASLAAPLIWPRWAFWLVWGATLWLPELANWRRGGESLLRDLSRGRPQRLLRLLEGGLLAGLVWELFNFWARCKWIYTVPFFDRLKLFEMPLLGFLGFPPLAVGAFATWSLLLPVADCDVAIDREASFDRGAAPQSRRSLRKPLLILAAVVAPMFCLQVFRHVLLDTVRSRRPLLGELAGMSADDTASLERAGIPSPERLERAVAQRGPAAVADAAHVPLATLEPAARQAALAIHKGMGSRAAAQLIEIGVPDVATLGRQNAATLAARLQALGDRTDGDMPRLAELQVWIEAARGRTRPRR
ncbi:MAG TPA: DUF4332 domain-containing protein [Thermoanaerobaculia bacterium]|nr:DUF4332 domain-containing protein [Thermoanaerobaculia bacterium]